ncbi:Light-inducible protein CPRF2 [Platanthera guangdongensis]|uniref:Light-inducible protein CPRF2 n=1 Tax=Platanthera guangdongensis TaxID=2320717 RepID=A0ABR2LVY4_9ASPA
MAENTVKRVTGMNPIFPTMSDISSVSIPFSGSPSEVTSDAAIPIHDDPNHFFAPTSQQGINSCLPEITSSGSPVDNAIHETHNMPSKKVFQRHPTTRSSKQLLVEEIPENNEVAELSPILNTPSPNRQQSQSRSGASDDDTTINE